MNGMECRVCGARGVAYVGYLRAYLCADHFVDYFERRFLRTIQVFRMVSPGERVAVAVSGGKDSLSLLYLFNKYWEVLGLKEVIAITIDEGVTGLRGRADHVARYARAYGVELVTVSFEDELGLTLDQMVDRLVERGLEYKPCSVCGVFKRYILNRVAREVGADKLAVGHNLDDEVQVFLMNIFRNSPLNLAREAPVTGLLRHERFVPRVKPLYYAPEREVYIYSLLVGIEPYESRCPYLKYSLRNAFRRWINRLELDAPGAKYHFLAAKEVMSTVVTRALASGLRLGTCRVCGEPSSAPLCRACLFKRYLGIEH